MTCIRIAAQQHLASFTLFDIGSNKSYLNQGLIDHESRTTLHNQLTELAKKLDKTSSPSLTLAFSGQALTYLRQEAPELLATYKELFGQGAFSLATQAFHGTATELVSAEQFQKQVLKHQEQLQEQFGASATTLLSSDELSPQQLTSLGCSTLLLSQQSLSLSEYLSGTSLPLQLRTDLQEHVLEEFSKLSPAVHSTLDAELITAFSQLATPEVIAQAHPENAENPYDHYTTLMSILHDIVHRINATTAIKQGVFLTTPEIGASPSSLLRT